MTREGTGCKKIFVKHISDKGLISRICKIFSKLKRTNSPIKKLGKDKQILYQRIDTDGK